jgi:hypothetical protein
MLPWAISRQVRVGMLTPRRLAIRRAVSSRRAVLASNKCRVESRISAGAVSGVPVLKHCFCGPWRTGSGPAHFRQRR